MKVMEMAIKTEVKNFKNKITQRPFDLFISRLDNVKVIGKNKWVASCPSHPDSHTTLNISLGINGSPIFICRAGCSAHEVIGATGLDFSDLFETKSSLRPSKSTQPNYIPSDVFEMCVLELTTAELAIDRLLNGKMSVEASREALSKALNKLCSISEAYGKSHVSFKFKNIGLAMVGLDD